MAVGCPVVAAQWQSTGYTSQVTQAQFLMTTNFFLYFTLFSSSSPHNIYVNLSLHYQQCYIIFLRTHKFTMIFYDLVLLSDCRVWLCRVCPSHFHTSTSQISVANVVPCTLRKRHTHTHTHTHTNAHTHVHAQTAHIHAHTPTWTTL